MTDGPVNLNRYRKEKAKADAKTRADANAVKHGRTKAERLLDAARPTRRADARPPQDRGRMTGRPVKRSLTLRGHRTSVSLEDEFWAAFRTIAKEKGRADQ